MCEPPEGEMNCPKEEDWINDVKMSRVKFRRG